MNCPFEECYICDRSLVKDCHGEHCDTVNRALLTIYHSANSQKQDQYREEGIDFVFMYSVIEQHCAGLQADAKIYRDTLSHNRRFCRGMENCWMLVSWTVPPVVWRRSEVRGAAMRAIETMSQQEPHVGKEEEEFVPSSNENIIFRGRMLTPTEWKAVQALVTLQ